MDWTGVRVTVRHVVLRRIWCRSRASQSKEEIAEGNRVKLLAQYPPPPSHPSTTDITVKCLQLLQQRETRRMPSKELDGVGVNKSQKALPSLSLTEIKLPFSDL